MSQIDHEMWQAARTAGHRDVFGTMAVTPPFRGALARGQDMPWAVRAWHSIRHASLQALDTIHLWLERARMRRQLLMLDDRLLKDIGMTRSQVYGEVQKPFWRA